MAVGVATAAKESCVEFIAEVEARFKGGGTVDADEDDLNEERIFCADGLRRIVGRCSVENVDILWTKTISMLLKKGRENRCSM